MSVTRSRTDSALTLPNLITLARIAAVPVLAWLMLAEAWMAAFCVFVLAGASDAIDGIIARHFDQRSVLGAWLDPFADKALLATAFVTLAALGMVPVWLVVLTVARDVVIVGGVMFAQRSGKPLPIRPLVISKATTLAQVVLVAVVLGAFAFAFDPGSALMWLVWTTTALTVASLAAYALVWKRHMAQGKTARDG